MRRGETAQSFCFCYVFEEKILNRVGHNLLDFTLQFSPLIFSVPVYLLSPNLFSRPSTTVLGRKLKRKEGMTEGRKERMRKNKMEYERVHNRLEVSKNEVGM